MKLTIARCEEEAALQCASADSYNDTAPDCGSARIHRDIEAMARLAALAIRYAKIQSAQDAAVDAPCDDGNPCGRCERLDKATDVATEAHRELMAYALEVTHAD